MAGYTVDDYFGGERPGRMVDLTDALLVEVEADAEGKLWVNVDGRCVLRIGRAALARARRPAAEGVHGLDVYLVHGLEEDGAVRDLAGRREARG